MADVHDLLNRLDKVHKVSGGWVACCPAHEDSNPSMSITEKDGKILLHCHAGCSAESIVGAVGLSMSDLMPEKELSPIRKAARKAKKPKAVARYDYQDEEGKTVYSVIRYEPKTFRQCRYDEHGQPVWKMDGVKRIPYRLPEVISEASIGGEVFIVEGEKDVETIRSIGFIGTCNAGGAGKWEDSWAEFFKGAARVTVIADNDTADKGFPGQKHAWHVYNSLVAAGIEARVMVMPVGKDVTEWASTLPKPSGEEFIKAMDSAAPWPDEWRFGADEKVVEDCGYTMMSLADFPPYVPEESNPNILIKGRWLERGGSAWIVSTAGTGKSVHSIQAAICWTEGVPFCALQPLKPLKMWIIQSEDSPSRVTIDREDIIAELEEKNPDIRWRDAAKKVKFLKFPGKVGAEFLDALDAALERETEKPDVVVLNPFMAFIGGPVSDGSYVTPFLRGGELNRQPTVGLQDILERHNVAALIYHHTPKPPTEKELKAWMSSTFPEYQGAGSSDITNWGRSFITMMKVADHPGMLCLTAGKNGNELGWDEIGGSRRHYLAYSTGRGITGRGRHAWRELTQEEFNDITGTDNSEQEVLKLVEEMRVALCERAMFREEMVERWGQGKIATAARARIITNLATFRLMKRHELVGRSYRDYYGQAESIRAAVKLARQKAEVDKLKEGENDG